MHGLRRATGLLIVAVGVLVLGAASPAPACTGSGGPAAGQAGQLSAITEQLSEQEPEQRPELELRALEILRRVPLIDGHNDAPWAIRDRFANRLDELDFLDTSRLDDPMHTDITRLRKGGVGGQLWSVWVPPELEGPQAVAVLIEQIDLVHRLVERYPDDLELALSAADIERIHSEGRIACLIGMEGSHSVGDSLAVLRQAYILGARYLTLTHWQTTGWADAATSAPRHDGLSEAGEKAVREMNRLGMMVDLSHVSSETMGDVLDITAAPVIFSHSNAATLDAYPRNVPDEVLERLPANGGIVMVNFAAFFISQDVVTYVAERKAEQARLETVHPGSPETVDQLLAAWKEAHPMPQVTISQLADHIEWIRKVAGVDHIGIGSDFDGISATPEGLDDVSDYPALLAELLRRGWSDDEVAAVAGGNLLRVLRRVEQVAAELQQTDRSQDPLKLLVTIAD